MSRNRRCGKRLLFWRHFHVKHETTVRQDRLWTHTRNIEGKSFSQANLTSCEQRCNGVKGCVALRYHDTSKHCHMLIGAAPTLAAFSKLLKPQADYNACVVVKS